MPKGGDPWSVPCLVYRLAYCSLLLVACGNLWKLVHIEKECESLQGCSLKERTLRMLGQCLVLSNNSTPGFCRFLNQGRDTQKMLSMRTAPAGLDKATPQRQTKKRGQNWSAMQCSTFFDQHADGAIPFWHNACGGLLLAWCELSCIAGDGHHHLPCVKRHLKHLKLKGFHVHHKLCAWL